MGLRRLPALLLAALLVCAGIARAGAAEYVSAKVLSVTDGDTIRVDYRGRNERLRMIGVNTPEIRHATKGVEPYGPEASAYTKRALAGRRVYLEFDAERRDRYGRLLAYVWTGRPHGGTDAEIRRKMFNARLLLDGYAQLMTVPPNVRYVEFFKGYQAEAREGRKGLWGRRKP